jgi:hypothetical protein
MDSGSTATTTSSIITALTTATSITTSLTTMTTTTTIISTTKSTTTSTTTFTTYLTTTSTTWTTTLTTVSTQTTTKCNNGCLYKIIKQVDMPFISNNMISSDFQSNRLTCGIKCGIDSLCQLFVFGSNKNCTLYKSLPSNNALLIPSLYSSIYYKI